MGMFIMVTLRMINFMEKEGSHMLMGMFMMVNIGMVTDMEKGGTHRGHKYIEGSATCFCARRKRTRAEKTSEAILDQNKKN